jgi:hypothetical protein
MKDAERTIAAQSNAQREALRQGLVGSFLHSIIAILLQHRFSDDTRDN